MTVAPTRAEPDFAALRRAKARAAALRPLARWTEAAKLRLLIALRNGIVTDAEVKAAHGLSDDDLAQWLAAYDGLAAAIVRGMAERVRQMQARHMARSA